MTALGPSNLPNQYTGTGTTTLLAANHNQLHVDIQDELRALWTKFGLGIGDAAAGAVLNGIGVSAAVWTTSPSITGGINVGSASGASAGQVRSSASLYPGNNGAVGLIAASVALATNATHVVGTSGVQGVIWLGDANTGENALVSLHAGAAAVTTMANDNTATWNVGADAGSVFAIYAAGGEYRVKNKTGSTRTFFFGRFALG